MKHFTLEGMSKLFGWDCLSIGTISSPNFPKPLEYLMFILNQQSIKYRYSPESSPITLQYKAGSYDSILIDYDRLLEHLPSIVSAFEPDVIITDEDDVDRIIDVTATLAIPTILSVAHAEWTLEYLKDLSRRVNYLIFDSEFLSNRYKDGIDCPNKVIYPILDWEQWIVSKNSDAFISMLNPVPKKGGGVFFKVTQACPNLQFLAQEGWHRPDIDLAHYPNVKWIERIYWKTPVENLKYLLSNSRILLAPSQWEDAFPTIIIHAMNNGIPVIGSNRGGIPEAIGDGGVVVDDFANVAAWKSALDMLLENNSIYTDLTRRARASARRISFIKELHKLNDVINHIVQAKLT